MYLKMRLLRRVSLITIKIKKMKAFQCGCSTGGRAGGHQLEGQWFTPWLLQSSAPDITMSLCAKMVDKALKYKSKHLYEYVCDWLNKAFKKKTKKKKRFECSFREEKRKISTYPCMLKNIPIKSSTLLLHLFDQEISNRFLRFLGIGPWSWPPHPLLPGAD